MKNNFTLEVVVASVLVVCAVLVLNPFHFWMPHMMVIGMLALFLVALAVFGVFVLDEKPVDEREEAHRSLAGRIAFLVGSTVVTLGIVTQEMVQESVDPWLVVALVLMVLSKIATRIYGNVKL